MYHDSVSLSVIFLYLPSLPPSLPPSLSPSLPPTHSSTGGDNPSRLIIGDVTRVQVELTYYNDESAEDAFIVQLDFCLPSFLTHNRVLGVLINEAKCVCLRW